MTKVIISNWYSVYGQHFQRDIDPSYYKPRVLAMLNLTA